MSSNLETISSTGNPLVKMLRSLERKKGRNETGLFLAEGARLVEQGLSAGWSLDSLVVSASSAERAFVRDLVDKAARSGARTVQVTDRLAGQIARKDNPQAVIGAFRQTHPALEDLTVPETSLWIALYEVRDPGNLGTILRTADCAGLSGVLLIGQCCDPYSVEAVRASMGSIFDIPFARASFDAFNTWRTGAGLSVLAASVNGTVRHTDADMSGPSVILMGNEQAGLPDAVEAKCDTLCLIPMRGGADSLNLAQATAVMTYEAWRQRDFK
ncbi:RNA methyltransferase [Henriciella sp.]|jgi:TrmH family RNA methyltransferase|uniref:TrmH family RNA methyltransferase n=1 Tax=Henriciella sp. TaxID=1968823 RepID=UPI0025BBC96D|nr:RNA methyltransferase [Henriciella sp.]|tara:strand:+ start:2432 stop:3244 length:813 start_codon:yes stop_codon:yes gene_type:complete